MNNNLNKLIKIKSLKRLLREQEESKKYIGFDTGFGSNDNALRFKSTKAPNIKAALDKADVPDGKRVAYYMLKTYYEEFTKKETLGKNAQELGIKSDKDLSGFTYEDLGNGKYKVISGPAAEQIGKIENFSKEKIYDDGDGVYKYKKDPSAEFGWSYSKNNGPWTPINKKGGENLDKKYGGTKSQSKSSKDKKYEFTDEQLKRIPKDLNQDKGDMFRDWINDNKSKEEIANALKDLPSDDKTLGRRGSFNNDHFKLAYTTFKEEYEEYLKKFGTNNEPVLMGFKKAETGKGIDKDYLKFWIDDVAVAIDTDGEVYQRPRGKGGEYLKEQRILKRHRYKILRERKLDVSKIIDKVQKGIESGSIKGAEKISSEFKDTIKKKADTLKKAVKSKSKLNIPTSPGNNSNSDAKIVNKAVKGLEAKINKAGGGKFTADQTLKSASQYEDVSKEIQVFIKGGEGFRSKVYDDKGGRTINSYEESSGYPTIGIGHLIRSNEREKFKEFLGSGSKEMNLQQALELFGSDVAKHTRVFKSQLKAPITHNMFVALASYCFNGGASALNKFKNNKGESITQLINQGRYKEAADVIDAKPRTSKGEYVQGLEKRRHEEAKLFLLGFEGESGEQKQQRESSDEPLPYVYIADSQGNSGLGKGIRKRLGTATKGKNFFQKNGATPAGVMSEFGEDKIIDAVSRTNNIILTLGGNGSSRASYLAKDILQNAPEDAQITWVLAPPAVKPTEKTTYVNTPGKPEREVSKFKATRAKRNREIVAGIDAVESQLGMSGRINVIDPYPWFESNVTSSRDGVHVDEKPGEQFVATIESEIMPKQKAMAENIFKTRKGKMILTEASLRKAIKSVLIENNKKDVEYVQGVIGTTVDGDWGPNTDKAWVAWIEKNIDMIIKAAIDKGVKKETILKFKNNAAQVASLVLNDPKKKNPSGVAEMVRLAQDPEAIKKATQEFNKKKNQDTGGKMEMAYGDKKGEPGTYTAGRGMKNRYYKFYIDDIVIAVDSVSGQIGQAKRGVDKNFKIEPLNESVRKIRNYLFKENYINPAKVYKDIKDGNYSGPDAVSKSFKGNSELQKKIIEKEKQVSKSSNSVKDNSSKASKKNFNPKEHAFLDEDSLPIKFEQLDMSAGAAEGERLLSQITGFGEKSEEGLKKINDIVVKQAITNHGDGKIALMHPDTFMPVNIKDSWKYLNRVAWSGHTFNAMVTPSHPAYDIVNSVPKQMGISYPWAQLMLKRQEVENDPESFIGQVVLLPFTREEVESRSDLNLLDGVFSLNGYSSKRGLPSGCGMKTFKKFAGSEPQSGAHMNVYSGGKLIGGNLDNTSTTGGTMKKISINRSHTVFLILVKIVPNKKALA